MKTIIVLLIAAMHAIAAEAPKPKAESKLPDSALVQYWRSIAIYHASNAALQSSATADQKHLQMLGAAPALSAQQNALQAQIENAAKKMKEAEASLRAACPKDAPVLDTSGDDPRCMPEVK